MALSIKEKKIIEISTLTCRAAKASTLKLGSEGEKMLIRWGRMRKEQPRQKEHQVQNPWGEEEHVLRILREV